MIDDYHIPALVDEVLEYLRPVPDGIYVDGTLGGGGHAGAILKCLSPRGKVIGFDMDIDALNHAKARLAEYASRIVFVHDNFLNLRLRLKAIGIDRVRGILLDLGVSSRQLENTERGFSFQSDSRLDMRMDAAQSLDAWTVINSYDEKRLADVLWKYGEERNSRRIAKKIVKMRKEEPIDTTHQLAQITETAVGPRWLMKSLARVFQAIRIEVNNELENLRGVLTDAVDILEQGGRIVVISYHSLEDRAVKQAFRAESQRLAFSGNKLIPDRELEQRLTVLTRKPVQATPAELARNIRARSAKLRAAERT